MFKQLLKKISIKQLLITVAIIIFSVIMSLKNTSHMLNQLQANSFENLYPLIDRHAFLVDQLTLTLTPTKGTTLRKKLRRYTEPDQLISFMKTLQSYSFDDINGKLPVKTLSKVNHLKYALERNQQQLSTAVAYYNAHAAAFNALFQRTLYPLYFKFSPYNTAPIIPSHLISTPDVLII